LAAAFALLQAVSGAELKPATLRAFEAYMAAAEREMEARLANPEKLLWAFDTPGRTAQLRGGQTVIGGTGGNAVRDVEDGLIHDWTGAIFLPGVKPEPVLAVLTDYPRHQEIYAPEVASSRLLAGEANDYHTHLRLIKKKIITVVLDCEFRVRWRQVGPGTWQSTTRSLRISEVSNPGNSGERIGPPDRGHGFLWRLNSYWTLVEKDSGTYVECRTISLTRGIPVLLELIIRPMVTSLPRESLAKTLEATRKAVLARAE
jgi:hypothetical protein